MRFIFSRRFYIILAIGLIPLSLSWNFPVLRSIVLAFDILLILAAIIDYFLSRKLPAELTLNRLFSGRFAIGDEIEVHLHLENKTPRDFTLILKDEYPPELKLSGERQEKFTIEGQTSAEMIYTLTPPKRGRYEFGQVATRYLSRLGLVWCQTIWARQNP